MDHGLILWGVLLTPILTGGICWFAGSPRSILNLLSVGVLATAGWAIAAALVVFRTGPMDSARQWLFLDALSTYHLLILMLVFSLSSLYAREYFEEDIASGRLNLHRTREYAALWSGSLSAMALVLVSNNLGIMWVGVEATTLLTAFLIYTHREPHSLEAMWKYLMICSVGIAFAFMGTLFVAASTSKISMHPGDALLWTRLREVAASLDAGALKTGFIFLLVGYGTKAGLAPMHSWLPDAHSQAPAPVSAVFSGFMLNTALYCILRYIPLVETCVGHSGWSLRLMVLFGILSILVAAAFIPSQHDLKRLLAYHSVEHIGIITLGVGLGGFGIFAALFHTLNHSLCKTLGFFCAGRLGQICESHDMRRMGGLLHAAPVWGTGLFLSLLALIGVAPFAIFISEFQILKAAVDNRSLLSIVLFLVASGIVFVGALRHAISMAWGETERRPLGKDATFSGTLIVWGSLGALLVLGLWLPQPLWNAIDQAAQVVGGSP